MRGKMSWASYMINLEKLDRFETAMYTVTNTGVRASMMGAINVKAGR